MRNIGTLTSPGVYPRDWTTHTGWADNTITWNGAVSSTTFTAGTSIVFTNTF